MRYRILFFFVLFSSIASYGSSISTLYDVELETTTSKLNITTNGILNITEKQSKKIVVSTPIANLWKLSVQNKKESTLLLPIVASIKPRKKAEIKNDGKSIFFVYDDLEVNNQVLPINVTFKISVHNDAYIFTSELQCNSVDWQFRELIFPVFNDIVVDNQKTKVYWPNGLGQCFESPNSFKDQAFDYPGGKGTMQWFSINTNESGLYIGIHDAERGKKVFKMSYNNERSTFSSEIQFPVFSQKFKGPEIVVQPYSGSWHTAAENYRKWFDQVFKMPSIPDWVKKDTGWLLAVLKQQNGHVMWNYSDIDKLCELAIERNLTTIGLFGWANGGHDNLFPNFIPDNLMGGRQALKSAIQRAHKKGIRIILYANAYMFDVSTEYYRYNGNDVALMQENQTPILMSVRKYFDATPVVFAMASPSSALWRKTMFDLAVQANELGADGILYDQMGVKDAVLDFSKLHDNQLPQEAFTKYRIQMLNEIRNELKKINPEFIIMTEATNDAVITDIDYHHGWGIGSAIDPVGFGKNLHTFTSMYRYTFPELIETQRNASPMITRSEANFSAVYGLRHEIETRYDEDVDYLLREKMPDSNSYSNVWYFPPFPDRVNERPAKDATQYIHDLIAFENKNADFFRLGTFIDEKDFKISGEKIVAKGFKYGDRLGVVVWNTDEFQKRNFQIKIKDYQLVEVSDMYTSHAELNAPMDANSIRLLVYRKQTN